MFGQDAGCGNVQDGGGRNRRRVANGFADFKTGHVRQIHIEKNQSRPIAVDHLQGLRAGTCFDDTETYLPQELCASVAPR